MKITKRQLRRIVKEEKAKLIREIRDPKWKKGYAGGAPARPGPITRTDTPGPDEWYDAINDLIYSELGASGGDMSTDGRSIIEALENLRRDIQDELGAGPLPMGVE